MSIKPNSQDIATPPVGDNPPVFVNLGVATIDGIIPVANLPVGQTTNTVAAGNDDRLTNAPRVVPTIVDLRALPAPVTGQDSDYVIVQGYYEAGDGGGGDFIWDATLQGQVTGFLTPCFLTQGDGFANVRGSTGTPEPVTVTISAPTMSGGTQATATATVGNVINSSKAALYNAIQTMAVVSGGKGYFHAPSVSFSPAPLGKVPIITALGNFDNGGTIILNNAGSGGWRRVGDISTVNALTFGMKRNDPTAAVNNSAALVAMRDSLPIHNYYGGGTGNDLYSGDYCLDAHIAGRVGTLVFPPGSFYLGSSFDWTPGMTLDCSQGQTIFVAKDGMAPATNADSSSNPLRYFFRLSLNGVYSYSNDPATFYPADPLYSPSDTYGAQVKGYLSLYAGGNNGALQGMQMLCAQGSKIDGELEVEGFATRQIVLTCPAKTLTCTTGAAPGIVISGSVNASFDRIDCEHVSNAANPLDPDGDIFPAVLVEGGSGNVINTLSGETNGLQLKVNGSPGLIVNSMACNACANYVVLQNSVDGVQINNMNATNGSVVAGGNWVYDRSPLAVYQNGGAPVIVPAGAANSYRQGLTVQGPVHVPSIDATKLTLAGQPVVHEVFTFNGALDNSTVLGRYRLRFNGTLPSGIGISSPTYFCRIRHYDSKEVIFLFSYGRDNNGNSVVNTKILEGSGLLVIPTNIGVNALSPQVDFTIVQPAAQYAGVCQMSVTQLGNFTLRTDNGPASFSWSYAPENQSNVTDGSAAGVLRAPGTPPITKGSDCSLFAADPDIEADASGGDFTITLHSATGNAGLERTISNAGTTHNVVVVAQSDTNFADNTYQKNVPPGTSLRLKVNVAGTHFLVL